MTIRDTAQTGKTIDALEFRHTVFGSGLAHTDSGIAGRSGVLTGLGLSISGMNLTVEPGVGVVQSAAGPASGSFVLASSGEAITVTARDASLTRYDTLMMRVYDNESDGTGQTTGAIELLKGTPAATPIDPPVPAGGIPLFRVTVPPGAAALSYIDRRFFTAAPGGIIPCTSTTRPSGAFMARGQAIYEIDTATVWVWGGDIWRQISVSTYSGVETALSGSNPPVGTPVMIKHFQTVANPEGGSGAGFSVNFPGGGFPNGLISVIAQRLDGAGVHVSTYRAGTSRSRYYFVMLDGAGNVINGSAPTRVAIQAAGW